MYVKDACSQHNTSHVDSTPCSVTFSTLAGMQLNQQLPFPRPLSQNKEKRIMEETLPNQRARLQTENAQQNPRTFQPSLGLLQQDVERGAAS
jgi:hypothetical protein